MPLSSRGIPQPAAVQDDVIERWLRLDVFAAQPATSFRTLRDLLGGKSVAYNDATDNPLGVTGAGFSASTLATSRYFDRFATLINAASSINLPQFLNFSRDKTTAPAAGRRPFMEVAATVAWTGPGEAGKASGLMLYQPGVTPTAVAGKPSTNPARYFSGIERDDTGVYWYTSNGVGSERTLLASEPAQGIYREYRMRIVGAGRNKAATFSLLRDGALLIRREWGASSATGDFLLPFEYAIAGPSPIQTPGWSIFANEVTATSGILYSDLEFKRGMTNE